MKAARCPVQVQVPLSAQPGSATCLAHVGTDIDDINLSIQVDTFAMISQVLHEQDMCEDFAETGSTLLTGSSYVPEIVSIQNMEVTNPVFLGNIQTYPNI